MTPQPPEAQKTGSRKVNSQADRVSESKSKSVNEFNAADEKDDLEEDSSEEEQEEQKQHPPAEVGGN